MHVTTFNIAFLTYMATCAVLTILCVVFMAADGEHVTVYSNIVVFIIGKWTGFLVAKEGKSRSKAATKVATKAIAQAMSTDVPQDADDV